MGWPVQIVHPTVCSGYQLHKEALRNILHADNVKDKPVVLISAAGLLRTGKSFLLNFFLQYLRSSRKEDWLWDRHVAVEGFSWRSGSERDTTGIWLWNEPFLVKRSQGDEVAVLLMDTHGMSDSDTAVQDYMKMFLFSALISSVQIYNITHNIQEDDLQRLQMCVESGRMALGKGGIETLFQRLVLVVRDWSFSSEAPYGEEGGTKMLNQRLKAYDKQPTERKSLRESIRSAFSAFDCFLLPHPGIQVATAISAEGPTLKLEKDFRDSIEVLVRSVLNPDSLSLKIHRGQEITCKDLSCLMEAYWEALHSKIGQPMSPPEEHISACLPALGVKVPCPLCDKEMNLSLLESHMQKDSCGRVAVCPFCSEEFKHRNLKHNKQGCEWRRKRESEDTTALQGVVEAAGELFASHGMDTYAALIQQLEENMKHRKRLDENILKILHNQKSGLLESLLPMTSVKKKIN